MKKTTNKFHLKKILILFIAIISSLGVLLPFVNVANAQTATVTIAANSSQGVNRWTTGLVETTIYTATKGSKISYKQDASGIDEDRCRYLFNHPSFLNSKIKTITLNVKASGDAVGTPNAPSIARVGLPNCAYSWSNPANADLEGLFFCMKLDAKLTQQTITTPTGAQTPALKSYVIHGPALGINNLSLLDQNGTSIQVSLTAVQNITNVEFISLTIQYERDPAITNNSVCCDQSFINSGVPSMLTGTSPGGGNGSYTYQWQSSQDKVTWTNVATTSNYSPPTLTQTTYYRRTVSSGNATPHISNEATISIKTLAINTGSPNPSSVCTNSVFLVPYSISGTANFTSNNVFNVQLSDISGSFSNAINIGTIQSASSGTVTANIPLGINGGEYKIRVVSSSPVIIGTIKSLTIISPSINTGNLNSVCQSSSFSIPFTANCFNSGNIFTAQLSDAQGSFSSSTNIGSISGSSSSTINASIPGNIIPGNGYKIRIIGSSPIVQGTTSSLVVLPPSITVGNLSSFCQGSTFSIPFIANCFNSGNIFTAQLSDAQGSFSSSTNIGSISGSSSSTINASIPGNTIPGNGYKVRIISSSPVVEGSASSLIVLPPSITIGNLSSASPGGSFSINYNSNCFKDGNIFAAELSDATGSFSNPIIIGSNNSIPSGNIISTLPANTPLGIYKVRIKSSNPAVISSETSLKIENFTFSVGSVSPLVLCQGNTISVPFSFTGVTFDANNVFTAQLSDVSGSFNSPINLGVLNATTSGIISSSTSSIPGGSGFRIRVTSSNPALITTNNSDVITINSIPPTPTISASGNLSFCAGGSVVLTSSSTSGNVWLPGGQTTQSITVNSSGSYSVKSVINGCSSSMSSPAIVNVTPLVPVNVSISVSPSTIVCGGENFTFTAAVTNGGNNPTYQWRVNDGAIGGNSQTFTSSTLKPSDRISCSVISSLPCVIENPKVSNEIIMTAPVKPEIKITISPTAYIDHQPAIEEIQWKDEVRCITRGNNIEKKFSNNGVGGAASVQNIEEGGFVKGTVPGFNGQNEFVILGLSSSNFNEYGNTIQYGVKVTDEKNLSIIESGVEKLANIKYESSKSIKIAILNNQIQYLVDEKLIYTSSIIPNLPLLVDVSLFSARIDPTARIEDVYIRPYGNTVVFTAHSENAGPNPIYQWVVNREIVGGNSPYFATADLDPETDFVYCKVTSSLRCNLTEVSNMITMSPPDELVYNAPQPDESYVTGYNLQACNTLIINHSITPPEGTDAYIVSGNLIRITSNDVVIGPNTKLYIASCDPVTSNSNQRVAVAEHDSNPLIDQVESGTSFLFAYPNPFIDETTVKYKIATDSFVKLYISSLVGERVATLVSKSQSPGEYSVIFNSKDLKSGVYLFVIETNGQKNIGKLILSK